MLRKYNIKGEKRGEGWAIIVIDTAIGYFSTVSDFGNYSYVWTHPGCEFRKFLCGLEVDYLRGKLLMGRNETKHLDGREVEKAIKEAIEERWESMRERGRANADSWKEDELAGLAGRGGAGMDDDDFSAWQSETSLEEPWEFASYLPDPQCTAFCEKVMPRLKKLLEEELEKEEKLKAESAAVEKIFASAGVDEKLRAMNDRQIADIVLNHVWAETHMFSPEDSLLQTVIERLTRTGGGPLPTPGS